jgi:uncharacterized membrane protein (UPF0127 family)
MMSLLNLQRLLASTLLGCVLLTGAVHTGATHAADTPPATAAPSVTSKDLDRVFRRSTLQIATPDARLHHFNIWIADDEQRRARGLMFIRQLAPDQGMLFIYTQPAPLSMWMKNTFVPLDMLFVGANGKVINVAANTEPQSLKTIESAGPALGVIELAGGTAARLKIAPGAQVIYPAFSASK